MTFTKRFIVLHQSSWTCTALSSAKCTAGPSGGCRSSSGCTSGQQRVLPECVGSWQRKGTAARHCSAGSRSSFLDICDRDRTGRDFHPVLGTSAGTERFGFACSHHHHHRSRRSPLVRLELRSARRSRRRSGKAEMQRGDERKKGSFAVGSLQCTSVRLLYMALAACQTHLLPAYLPDK